MNELETPEKTEDLIRKSLMTTDDLAAWYINGDYNKQIPSMEPSGQLTGAAIALACLFSFDQQPDRDRIRLI